TDLSEGNRRLEHELSTVINEKEALGQKVNDLSESNQRLKHELDEVIEERKALDQKANELSQDSLRLNKELSREKETIRNKDLVLGVLRATLEEERFVNKRSLFKRLMSSFPLTSLLTVYPGFSSSDGQSGGDPPLQKTSDSPDDAKCDSATSPSVPFLLSPPGWEMILRAIEEVVGDKALRIIPCVDTFFACHGAEISEDWIGFLHTPQHLPKFWLETIRSYGIKRESILNIEYLDRYRHHCKGIITFSQNHAQMLQKLSGLNIKKVTYPLINTKTRWSWKRFKNNPHKKIIQIGWWLQRMHAIYMLPESDYEKVYIKNFSSFADEVFEKERKEAEQKRTFSGSMEHSVSHIEKASRREYFNILKENIAFVHYHDVTLPGLVLDCIATGTPVLVNALPSVLEYLGKDYPLYYYSYADAIEKAKDDTLIRKAHDHLKRLHQNTEFQMKHFVSEIQMLLPEES
ncbi:MAG: hypothetical protein JW896_15895, partial [Deltaproteobacteria bacterium]|nr:hypothetical protein [Deltaproteobacteria bacterium]